MDFNELLQMKSSLRRAPPPSPNKDNVLPGVKLRTGFRASLIADESDFKVTGPADDDEPENEILRVAKLKRALVVKKQEDEEEIKWRPKPLPKPKPYLGVLNRTRKDLRILSMTLPPRIKPKIALDFRNVAYGECIVKPKRSCLPTLESLGKPPAKPVKVDGLEKFLQKYSRADIVIAQRRFTLTRKITAHVGQTEEKEEEEIKSRPKPKPRPKPHLEGKENERKLSSSFDDTSKEDKENLIDVRNVMCRDSRGEPKRSFLPTLESLGKPPAKPVKVEGLGKLLQKYSRADIVIVPQRITWTRNTEGGIGTTGRLAILLL